MRFYVYELVVVPDGNVCYIGKGSGKRMYVHRKNLNHHGWSQTGLYRRLRELIASGKDFYPRKVFETDDEAEAFAEESKRIALYGLDNLFNSSDHRCRWAADVDVAMRQAMARGQREKAKRNRRIYGKGLPPEHCAHIGDGNRGKKKPAQTERLKRAWAEGRMHNDGSVFRRLNKSRIGIPFSVERCAKLSAVRKGKPQGPHILRVKSKHRVGRTGWVGVSVCPGSFGSPFGFVARVNDPVNRRLVELGRYSTAKDAAIAYDDAFDQLHGVRPNGTAPRQSFLVLHRLVEQNPNQYVSYA